MSSGTRADLWGMGVGLSLLGLQATTQLPALNPRDVQPLLGFVLPRHALARAAPAHTQTHTNVLSHTPPSAQRLLPAASPQLEPDSRDAGHGAGTGAEVGSARATAWDSAGKRCPGSPQAGAGTWTPGLQSVPPRLAASSHWRPEAWSRGVGRGRGGCCACELERPFSPRPPR